MTEHRLPIKTVAKNLKFNLFFLFSPLMCCCRRDASFKYEKGRVVQMNRKLDKV